MPVRAISACSVCASRSTGLHVVQRTIFFAAPDGRTNRVYDENVSHG
jgi:hypothetical protein